MDHQKSIQILDKYVKNSNLKKHAFAVEAVMKKLAEHFKKTEEMEKWALAGLLHDMDWELTKTEPEKHGLLAADILTKESFDEDVVLAIKKHNHTLGFPLETLMEKALFCAEELTGLITACALVNPEKLSGVKISSVIKKFKEPSFAKGVNREIIAKSPELINLNLEELIELSLEAMIKIKDQLGL
jgi:putative nucleotidyltransferase with HDIG domain